MLELGASVWPETLAQLRACGAARNECIVYWVGPLPSDRTVNEVVHPKHSATPGHYEIDQAWLTRFWFELSDRGAAVRAQVHTHGGRASHSSTDDDYPIVQTPGFLSIVLPRFGMRELEAERIYVAELRPGGSWSSRSLADVVKEVT